MCDFSLEAVRSRPAKVGDKLTTYTFNWGTRGFCAPEDQGMAVCLLPGSEVSFAEEVRQWAIAPRSSNVIGYRTAIFREVNKYLVLAQERRCLSHATARLGHRNVQHTVRYTDSAPDRSKDFWRR